MKNLFYGTLLAIGQHKCGVLFNILLYSAVWWLTAESSSHCNTNPNSNLKFHSYWYDKIYVAWCLVCDHLKYYIGTYTLEFCTDYHALLVWCDVIVCCRHLFHVDTVHPAVWSVWRHLTGRVRTSFQLCWRSGHTLETGQLLLLTMLIVVVMMMLMMMMMMIMIMVMMLVLSVGMEFYYNY